MRKVNCDDDSFLKCGRYEVKFSTEHNAASCIFWSPKSRDEDVNMR